MWELESDLMELDEENGVEENHTLFEPQASHNESEQESEEEEQIQEQNFKIDESEEEDIVEDERVIEEREREEEFTSRPSVRVRPPMIPLNISKNGTPPGFNSWSLVRKRAYVNRHLNPNQFYYRFNEPGEQPRHGDWTTQEHQLFLKRLSEVGPGEWGIFSQKIPGRVGYQCRNYYE